MAITYSIDGGADAAKFNINAASGALTFKVAPDFEKPGDANADNIYEVSVKATDATGLASSKLVKVTVTDVSEGAPPQITSAGAISIKENSTAVMTVTATDPDDTTTPPIEPPIEPPVSTGWPDANSAGVRAGVTLTSYSGPMIITAAGTVVSGKRINGTLTIKAANVVIRDCEIKNFSNWGILQDGDNLNARVEYCDIDATGSHATTSLGVGGGSNAAIIGCDIKGGVIAINMFGPATIRDNYIHDMNESSSAAADRHFDGIRAMVSNSLIENNWIALPPSEGGTAAVFIKTEWGNVSNVKVNHNYMKGKPSYTVYSEETAGKQITGVEFTNNTMERGIYGYGLIQNNTVVWTGNVDLAGNPIPNP